LKEGKVEYQGRRDDAAQSLDLTSVLDFLKAKQ
jgi:hypothetical protein